MISSRLGWGRAFPLLIAAGCATWRPYQCGSNECNPDYVVPDALLQR